MVESKTLRVNWERFCLVVGVLYLRGGMQWKYRFTLSRWAKLNGKMLLIEAVGTFSPE